MKFRKKPVEVEAHQWFKNGDHPGDKVGEDALDLSATLDKYPNLLEATEPVEFAYIDGSFYAVIGGETNFGIQGVSYKRIEGSVVRFFRHPAPEYAGDKVHIPCAYDWQYHGWIDTLEGGHTVCPGDWIITHLGARKGEHYPCKPDIFAETYEKVD